MLSPMDIVQAGPWIPPWVLLVLVPALVLAGVGALLLLRRRNARRRPAAAGDDGPAGPRPYGDDDLAAFLESPPGTAGSPAAPPGGWPALAGEPGAASSTASLVVAEPSAGTGRRRAVALGALALTVLLIVAAVLAFALRPGSPGPGRAGGHAPETADLPPVPAAPTPGQPGAGELADVSVQDGGAARLEFGGLVLEQRAVGITATYPVVEATWNGTQGVAHVRLPTFNCLTVTAPENPVAAGCVPTVPEYGDLPSPAVTITGDDGTVQLSGSFPTYVRPNGTPPVWTGHVYELRVRAAPVDGQPAEGWVRAEGEIRLGSGRATSLDSADVTVLRQG